MRDNCIVIASFELRASAERKRERERSGPVSESSRVTVDPIFSPLWQECTSVFQTETNTHDERGRRGRGWW